MRNKLKLGDLVRIDNSSGVKSYDSNPLVHGFHRATWIDPGRLGVVTHVQDSYVRLICDDCEVWIESRHLEVLSDAR